MHILWWYACLRSYNRYTESSALSLLTFTIYTIAGSAGNIETVSAAGHTNYHNT